ncbi:hypothetical protein AVEN_143584-1 [Araneus ventricosus]|uniref:DUF4371 domain-containing protein n=1 Tax=Araneus ventricosus TaxID=182803 RepID=A0A4Y2AP21_ARAVE|nr:hypothetical protein AVEN_143584-1 [Araneus ventricosus]
MGFIWAFFRLKDQQANKLFDVLLRELESLGSPLVNMRGKGCDNGANMKGKHAGVQAKSRNINPRAFLNHVVTTSLNLLVNDLAKIIIRRS